LFYPYPLPSIPDGLLDAILSTAQLFPRRIGYLDVVPREPESYPVYQWGGNSGKDFRVFWCVPQQPV
jgi:hypothetical protein